jgi:hypothetical protein
VLSPGRELLTTYEQGNDGFWDAIRMNLAQYCYVQTLDKKSKVGHHVCVWACTGIASSTPPQATTVGWTECEAKQVPKHVLFVPVHNSVDCFVLLLPSPVASFQGLAALEK